MLYTTSWWIISPVTHTARSTVARLPHCVRSRPALYRAQRLARCRMSSTLQIWGLWPQETSSVSMVMIHKSSPQLPTSTLDAPSSTTCNTGQTRITQFLTDKSPKKLLWYSAGWRANGSSTRRGLRQRTVHSPHEFRATCAASTSPCPKWSSVESPAATTQSFPLLCHGPA